ncbi:CHASE3 domain-containing protein [Leptolyngbya sp. 7M]|uniref:CHASE3 domain-containing protein n=1 Tax=Leptolyngbya sp. 7M TaxID=2812896 RepID=UPI001B8AD3E9|nr:CHASE3 domain-containing protein [Leptolyngbya sp. 7M]QYO64898.1 CHASE3 domain-containing protein [Leptolyngbya sp. 7M]
MKGSLERKWIVGGFSLALLLMTGVSLASYRNTIAITENTNHVQQTYEVLNQLATLYAELLIAESGRRGYVFLKNQQELQRYQLAVAKIQQRLQVVQAEIHHTGIQPEQYQHLVSLINQRLELLQESIDLHQKQLLERLEPEQVMGIAEQLLKLTYDYPAKTLSGMINENLARLPGGENWWRERQQR